MTELEKLKKYLDDNGYYSEWNGVYGENDQIIVYKNPAKTNRYWDVVCHRNSYGGDQGLLEIYGELLDDVEGDLTADKVIEKYLKGGKF